MDELKINRGVELMLRGARPKDDTKPEHGVLINKVFSLLKLEVYFNFELRWGRKKN